MAVRHEPILPRRSAPPKGQRRGKGQHRVQLSMEQRIALQQWQQDMQKMWPEIQKAGVMAQRLFQEMIDAPQWQIAETERPEWHAAENAECVGPHQLWTVGHAKVNYVDHIDVRSDPE